MAKIREKPYQPTPADQEYRRLLQVYRERHNIDSVPRHVQDRLFVTAARNIGDRVEVASRRVALREMRRLRCSMKLRRIIGRL